MKPAVITVLFIGFSVACSAQKKAADAAKVQFTPPVIVKTDTVKAPSVKVVKFTPPVIVKDKPIKKAKAKKEAVKFTPPVIVKDPG